MKIYQIGICDDEIGTSANLETIVYDFFAKLHYAVEVTVWYSGEDFCHSIEVGDKYDILFLDIELPNMNGVSVGKYIRDKMNNQGMQIVFISSKTNYAMELFQIHPYDFLVKPIKKDIVFNTLNKLLAIDSMDERFFSYQINRMERKVMHGKIMYFSSCNKRIDIILSDGTIESFPGKLKDIIDKLPAQFVRTAQSFIVNLKYVTSYKFDNVIMGNDVRISITTPYRENFRKTLIKYNEGANSYE